MLRSARRASIPGTSPQTPWASAPAALAAALRVALISWPSGLKSVSSPRLTTAARNRANASAAAAPASASPAT